MFHWLTINTPRSYSARQLSSHSCRLWGRASKRNTEVWQHSAFPQKKPQCDSRKNATIHTTRSSGLVYSQTSRTHGREGHDRGAHTGWHLHRVQSALETDITDRCIQTTKLETSIEGKNLTVTASDQHLDLIKKHTACMTKRTWEVYTHNETLTLESFSRWISCWRLRRLLALAMPLW